MNIITESCYNEGYIHMKYRQWDPNLNRVITEFRVIMRLQCIDYVKCYLNSNHV